MRVGRRRVELSRDHSHLLQGGLTWAELFTHESFRPGVVLNYRVCLLQCTGCDVILRVP